MSTGFAPRPATTGLSKEAARLFADLMAAQPAMRRRFMAELSQADLAQVLLISSREAGTPYALWRDDPVGFVQDVLHESTWSKPRHILGSIPHVQKVCVPSCFSSGKTWSAARAVLWWSFTHAPGTAKAITMAPTWRQVVRLLWSEVRSAHSRARLPGAVDMAQLKIPDVASGMEVVAAYGLSAAPWNEAAVQGIHAPNLLLIIDEAGGIGHTIGRNLRGMLSSEGSHMLAIGNPPTDEEESWFEGQCALDESVVIPISAYDTPALSGEDAPRCLSCHPGDVHPVTRHLVEEKWVDETVREHGEDSHYVQAKVHARFPTGGPSRVIPASWIDAAHAVDEPDEPDLLRLTDLGVAGESEPWLVQPGAWIRLGVDVAADGGDELVISRMVGDLITIRHASSGAKNANSVDVAGVILAEIRRAQELAAAIGTRVPVRVKIDGIGVGWGVAGTLKAWATEGLHDAQIVSVVVSEATDRVPDSATMRPHLKRDEMWLAMRHLLEPRGEIPPVRLRVDRKTLAQLRAPTMGTTSAGWTKVEAKAKLKKRGLSSPDRAEAVLLAVYEPAGAKRKKARLVV